MSGRLIVDNTSQLQEMQDYPKPARITARVISFIFHPVFVPIYLILFLLYIHPTMFAGVSPLNKRLVFFQALLMYSFFPLITVFLLKALKFIPSIYLSTQRDRIIPFVICNIWYFWIWYVWRNIPGSPKETVLLSMTIFIASSIGLMANIYMKISMHTIAMGVAISFLIFLALTESTNFGVYLSAGVLVTGLVCTARFIASDHTRKEIYGGLLTGPASLLIASLFV